MGFSARDVVPFTQARANLSELAEQAKVSIRNIRRDANKSAEQAQKDKQLSEDARDDVKDEVQELTKKYESQASGACKSREVEVMED